MINVVDAFKAARRCSTPLLSVSTPDQYATLAELKNVAGDKTPQILWDLSSGVRALNDAGGNAIPLMTDQPAFMQNPGEVLQKALELPEDAIVYMMTANRVLSEPVVMQALLNLRDAFKVNNRSIVLLGPGFQFPPEVEGDVIELDEELPEKSALEVIVRAQFENAAEAIGPKFKKPTDDVIEKAVDALLGLPAFAAEQVTAMSMSRDGLNIADLWDRKRQSIERTPGLAVWRGGETFADVGGCDNIKAFISDVISGEEPPRAIVFIDEIEKALAGAGTDTSGTTTNQLGQLLSFMQDTEADGVMFIGHPGTSKSLIAKAAGNTAKVPTISLDLGGMKDSLVGASEARTRAALKVVQAVSQGRALFIATCNGVASLPPELRRRFTFGEYFFDLPTAEERQQIWDIYFRKYSLPAQPLPDDKDWTGAEIKNCARLAWKLRRPLVGAAKHIVPISRSAPDRITRLQDEAHGRYNSASYEGTYEKTRSKASSLVADRTRRSMKVG